VGRVELHGNAETRRVGQQVFAKRAEPGARNPVLADREGSTAFEACTLPYLTLPYLTFLRGANEGAIGCNNRCRDMQRRSPLCKPRFLRVAKLLRFQSSTLGTGVVGGVAQGRAGCSDRAVSESVGARRHVGQK
jgi:hypothetical protein